MLSASDGARVVSPRVYLCGRVTVECGGLILRGAALGSAQGRLLLAFLGTRRTRPASRMEALDALWGGTPPPSAETSFNVIVSKLRAAVRSAGVPAPHGVVTDSGPLQLALDDAWFDIEAARASLDEAEGALQRTWRRASIVLSAVSTAGGEHQLGIQHAEEAYASEPFDEVACQTLTRAHAAAGNRAEALRVFARCRRLFREELGADPSGQTTSAFLEILRAKS